MLQLYTHSVCLQHDPGAGHAESPARLRAVLEALDHDRFAALDRIEAPRVTREQLLRVHDAAYVDRILSSAPSTGTLRLDEDTIMSPAVGRSRPAGRRCGRSCCRRCYARQQHAGFLRRASAGSSRNA